MSNDQGPERLELLAGHAGDLFREIVKIGVLPEDDPRLVRGHADQQALALLIDRGLLRENADGGWVAVDPAAVQSGVVSPMGRQAVDLLKESAAWADTFGTLA